MSSTLLVSLWVNLRKYENGLEVTEEIALHVLIVKDYCCLWKSEMNPDLLC
jgi:hypothetical protein